MAGGAHLEPSASTSAPALMPVCNFISVSALMPRKLRALAAARMFGQYSTGMLPRTRIVWACVGLIPMSRANSATVGQSLIRASTVHMAIIATLCSRHGQLPTVAT
jgi:hypothetical protein